MSRTFKIILFVIAIALLLVVAYIVVTPHRFHRSIDTVGKILILSDHDNPGHPHIWLMKRDGTGAVALTKGNEIDSDPSFSPDGTQIVFVSDRSHSPQIWLMDADGKAPEMLTSGNDAKSLPKFSPDGNEIAYIARGALTVMGVQDHSPDILLPIPSQDATANSEATQAGQDAVSDFAWAPVAGKDTTPIAAIQDSQDGTQHLTLVNTGADKPVNVIRGSSVTFAWTPDGNSMLAAVIGVTGIGIPEASKAQMPAGVGDFIPPLKNMPVSAMFTINADGSLAQAPPLLVSKTATSGAADPVYSPDKKFLSFEVWSEASYDVSKIRAMMLMKTDGSTQPLALALNGTAHGEFSPDGSWFTYTSPVANRADRRDLVVLSTLSGQQSVVTGGQWDIMRYMWSPAKPKAAE